MKSADFKGKLKLAKHITLQDNGKPFLKQSSSHSLCPSSTTMSGLPTATEVLFQGEFQSQLAKWQYLSRGGELHKTPNGGVQFLFLKGTTSFPPPGQSQYLDRGSVIFSA